MYNDKQSFFKYTSYLRTITSEILNVILYPLENKYYIHKTIVSGRVSWRNIPQYLQGNKTKGV
jgi:hypothetical protein